MGLQDRSKSGSSKIPKPAVHRLIVLQVLITVLICGLCFGMGGELAAKSALLGGLVAIVPNAYFAWRAMRYNQTRSAAAVLGSMYAGELGKIALSAVMFALVFKFVETLAIKTFFIVFVLVLLTGALAAAKLLR